MFMVALGALTLFVCLAFVAHWGASALTQARAQNIADSVALAAAYAGADTAAVAAVIRSQPADIRPHLQVETTPAGSPDTTSDALFGAGDGTVSDPSIVQVKVVLANRTAYAAAKSH